MPLNWRRNYWKLGGSAAQLVVVIVAAQLESLLAWRFAALLVAALSLVSWVLALRHVRAVSDTPTSKVVSAAQGYVELSGIGRPFDGPPLLAQLTHQPCLWFRYLTEVKNGDKWRTDGQGESDASFILDDGSGQCLVDPEGAELIPRIKQTWTEGNRRYTEWRIHEGDDVYVLGHFVTRGFADLQLSVNEDLKHLLAQWKQDSVRLHQRFDLDGDGQLSEREWELARAQARREVLAQHREARNQADIHVMLAPPDSRLYLIATIDPHSIVTRYRWWAAFHLVCFFGALAVFAHLLRMMD